MDLILWRHAEAHDARDGQSDLDRPLTSRGERQAQRMADWLQRHLADSTRILVSPAVRTQQTAKALSRSFKTCPELLPEASPVALLELVRWPESNKPVLVVGHQPTLGQAAALLLSETHQSWTVRKGGVWWLRQRVREGSSQVVLQAALSPDML